MAAAPNTNAAVNDAENRIVGMMVGSAVADAQGIYTDSLKKNVVNSVYGRRRILASYKANELTPHYPDDHRAKYNDGDWSEATEMALCSLFSFVHVLHPEASRQYELAMRLRQLSSDGNRAYGLLPLDLGQPIKNIVESADFLADLSKRIFPALKSWMIKERGTRGGDGFSAPLMRVHPVAAIATEYNMNTNLIRAVENCRVTHVDARCNISVMIAVSLLRGLLRQEVQTEQQINPIIQTCKRQMEAWVSNFKRGVGNKSGAFYTIDNISKLSSLLTAQSLEELQLDNSEDRGDVWKCLSAGVFCLRTAMVRLESLSGQEREDRRKVLFAELIDRLVKEGGMAKANATFAGALLGAYLGYDAIPKAWRSGLNNRKFLMRKCKLLCTFVGVIPGDKDQQERDSQLYPARDASDRRVMEGNIEKRRQSRKDMLVKRWNDPNLQAKRRKTMYGNLQFPPLKN